MHQKFTAHGLGERSVVVLWEEGGKVPVNFLRVTCPECGLTTTPGSMASHVAAHRLPPRFRCDTCSHLTGDLDEAEAHRSATLHLLYSEKGVSEVWFYDLPNEAMLFADA